MSMKPGSKYYPLFEHLQHCNQAVVSLTFAEIKTLMGCSLPASALKKKNWWSNRDSPSALQAIAWISAGYQVESVDLTQQTITFKTFQATYSGLQIGGVQEVWCGGVGVFTPIPSENRYITFSVIRRVCS